jgi:mono/diheme cytochrome c family protein
VSSCRNNDYNKDGIELQDVVDFNYHVKPILSDKCFACHGPDKNALKANLRWDISEGAIKKNLNSGNHAIVPNNLRKREAFQRIISKDPTLQMPPPEFGLTLTKEEIAILGKWKDILS